MKLRYITKPNPGASATASFTVDPGVPDRAIVEEAYIRLNESPDSTFGHKVKRHIDGTDGSHVATVTIWKD